MKKKILYKITDKLQTLLILLTFLFLLAACILVGIGYLFEDIYFFVPGILIYGIIGLIVITRKNKTDEKYGE